MGLSIHDYEHLVHMARAYIALEDASTINHGDGLATGAFSLNRNNTAKLINRFYKETPGVGTPPDLNENV